MNRHSFFYTTRLVLALASFTAMTGAVHAQGTVGKIFGHGPAGATVTATSSSGAQRHTTINDKGRYTITPVPMGSYSVALEKDGVAVDTRKDIPITVGRGAEIDFACPGDNCAAAN